MILVISAMYRGKKVDIFQIEAFIKIWNVFLSL